MNKNYQVIRTASSKREWITDEIYKGVIRQGWGLPGMQLIEDDKEVLQGEWIENYKDSGQKFWGETKNDKEAKKRYRILSRMLKLSKGDLVIVPKIPNKKSFVLASVEDGYSFDTSPAQEREGLEDLRHQIKINKKNIKTFNYYSSPESKVIQKKMRAYQSAINNVKNKECINAIKKLLEMKSDLNSKKIASLIEEIKSSLSYREKILKNLRNKFKPNDIEKIILSIFENAGYEKISTNVYDKEGGDVDIIITKDLPIISNIEDFGLNIYIQVKQKEGVDRGDTNGVEQLNKIAEEDKNCLKILVSTADEFTNECVALAEEKNVLLLSGEDFVDLFIKYF